MVINYHIFFIQFMPLMHRIILCLSIRISSEIDLKIKKKWLFTPENSTMIYCVALNYVASGILGIFYLQCRIFNIFGNIKVKDRDVVCNSVI